MRTHAPATRAHRDRLEIERRSARPRPPRSLGRARPLAGADAAAADIVAHELRTPLTTLVIGSRLLLRDELNGRPRTGVALDLAAETRRLADAVEDLLVLVGIDEPLPAEPLSLQHLVQTEIRQATTMSPDVRFRAVLPADVPPVVADEADVRHVVRSLVSQGIAGAGVGGTVEADLDDLPHDRVRLRVRGSASRRTRATPPDRQSGILREAALGVLATRLGATVTITMGPRRVLAQVVIPASPPVAMPGSARSPRASQA